MDLLTVSEDSVTPVGKNVNQYHQFEDEFLKGRVYLSKIGEYLDATMSGTSAINWRYVKTGLVVTLGDEDYLLVYFEGGLYYTYEDTFYFNYYLLPLLEVFNKYLGTKVTYTEDFIKSVEARFKDGYVSQYKLHKLIMWLKDSVFVETVQEFVEGMASIFGGLIGEGYIIQTTPHYIEVSYPGYLEESLYIFNDKPQDDCQVDIRQVRHRCKVNEELPLMVTTTKIINVFIGYYLMGSKTQRVSPLPKNRVSYALGKPISLMHRDKIDYYKQVKQEVEAELTTFTSYVRTNYNYSNTTSSIYLEIKFKNCPHLYISIRDHEGLKEKRYISIYVKNRDLSDLGEKLRPLVINHIKNTKYI